MTDFQTEMNRAVQGFVAQITTLARQAAVDTLESAFSKTGGRAAGRGEGRGAGASSGPVGRPRGRGAKRTREYIEELATKVITFVKANPGLRIEQINKELGTSTKDLALPIRKLVSEGMLTTKGQKRSTAYFAGRKAK